MVPMHYVLVTCPRQSRKRSEDGDLVWASSASSIGVEFPDSLLLAFSPIGLVAVPICAGRNLPPRQKPVMEIGKERGSAEATSQRADAASSWNTLEGGVLDSFRRLGTERVTVGLHIRPIA